MIDGVLVVTVTNDNIEVAIVAFRKETARNGVLKQLRARMRDDPKPSEKRKKKARIASKRRERIERRRGEPVERPRPIQKGFYSPTRRIEW